MRLEKGVVEEVKHILRDEQLMVRIREEANKRPAVEIAL